jgi:hypothetical protein
MVVQEGRFQLLIVMIPASYSVSIHPTNEVGAASGEEGQILLRCGTMTPHSGLAHATAIEKHRGAVQACGAA